MQGQCPHVFFSALRRWSQEAHDTSTFAWNSEQKRGILGGGPTLVVTQSPGVDRFSVP